LHLERLYKSHNSLILALDVGTSSVRAALYDHAGNVLPETMVKNERVLTATEEGGAEIDADVGFGQVVAAVDDVLEKAGSVEGEITHVAVSSFWHSLVGVDESGKPTTAVLSWADTRSREYVAELRKKLDETETHNRCGARFHSSFWPAKLLWFRKESPDVFKRTAMWLSFSDFAAMKLTGGPTTSVSMASATGIFDIRRCGWDEELIKFLKVKNSQFPPIGGEAETFRLEAKYARRWPRLKNSRWFPAIGDGAANNIGAGCTMGSKAALMVGTSGAMRVAYGGEPPEEIPSGLWCYRVDRKRVIVGGALSDGGGLYHWLKDNLRTHASDDKVEAEIARRPPAGHGLTFLPFLFGERSTGYHDFATGAVLGLKATSDAIDIVHAALEAVAYRFAEVFDQLNQVRRIREIVASGGALRESPVWTQIIANALDRTLSLPEILEASSRGAVLLALEKIGALENLEALTPPKGANFVPEKELRGVYLKARTRHRDAYDALMSSAVDAMMAE